LWFTIQQRPTSVFLLGLGQIAITDSDIRSAADGWSNDNDPWDAFGHVEEVVGTSDLNEESTDGRLLIEGDLSSRMHDSPPSSVNIYETYSRRNCEGR
jgi:hypothetical protein